MENIEKIYTLYTRLLKLEGKAIDRGKFRFDFLMNRKFYTLLFLPIKNAVAPLI